MLIFSGLSNKPLAEDLAKHLKQQVSPLEIVVFPDGEKRVRVIGKVVGEKVAVVESTSTPPDQNYMELFFIVDALKRSGASEITAVIPYLGYERQDHIFRDGEAVSLEVIAQTLARVGVNRLVAFDLHSIKVPELFTIPVLHLSALDLFAEKIRELGLTENSVLVSPDMGGIRRIKILSEKLGSMPFAVVDKDRDLATGEVEAVDLEGNVKGKTAVIVDDMISTGGTIVEASKLLLERGAKKVIVFATHPVFSKDSRRILSSSPVEKVYVTDTIFVPETKRFPKLEILSVAKMIANSLK